MTDSARLLVAGLLSVALLVAACGGNDGIVASTTPPLYLLRYTNNSNVPTALFVGTIRFRNKCIWIEDDTGYASVVLWPPGSDLDIPPGGEPQIVFATDGQKVRNGERVTFGGGEQTDLAFVRQLLGNDVPAECQAGSYWMASTVSPG